MNLRWNTSEYGGVKDLRIPPHRLWKPGKYTLFNFTIPLSLYNMPLLVVQDYVLARNFCFLRRYLGTKSSFIHLFLWRTRAKEKNWWKEIEKFRPTTSIGNATNKQKIYSFTTPNYINSTNYQRPMASLVDCATSHRCSHV